MPPAGRERKGLTRTYRVGASTVQLGFGDILGSGAEVLVSSDDFLLTMGGGVSGAIARAGGNAIRLDATKAVPCTLGDVVVTTAGALDARHVFHVVTIGPEDVVTIGPDDGPTESNIDRQTILVAEATTTCLRRLEALGLSSIAFPALGAGVAGIEPETVALAMADAIEEHLRSSSAAIAIELHLLPKRWQDELDYVAFFETFAARLRATPARIDSETIPPSDNDDPLARQRRRILAVGRERADIERSLEHELRTGHALSEQTADAYLAKTSELASELDRRTPVKLFVSYAHDDRREAGEFIKHLAGLRLTGVATWSDHMIAPGAIWDDAIRQELEEADVALFLVTASFLASEYCVGEEWRRAHERRSLGEMAMIPVVLKACDWQSLIGNLQALPEGGKPIAGHPDFDLACLEVVNAVRLRIG